MAWDNKDDWWVDENGEPNARFTDFELAVHGFEKAYGRLENGEDPHVIIECCWWISVATETWGRRNEDSVLGGIYWVRNKGFHQLATALGQMQPPRLPGTFGVGRFDESVFDDEYGIQYAVWLPLGGDDDGSRHQYNEHMKGRTVYETLDEVHGLLTWEIERIRPTPANPEFLEDLL